MFWGKTNQTEVDAHKCSTEFSSYFECFIIFHEKSHWWSTSEKILIKTNES